MLDGESDVDTRGVDARALFYLRSLLDALFGKIVPESCHASEVAWTIA